MPKQRSQGKQWLSVVIFTEGAVTPANILILSAASPPDRPTPGPTPPGGGGEYPSHPIFYPPGTSPGYPGWGGEGEHPEFPIAGPPWFPAEPGGGGGGGEVPEGAIPAVVAPTKPPADGSPAPTPPADMPAGTAQMDLHLQGMQKGQVVQVWVPPYAAHHG